MLDTLSPIPYTKCAIDTNQEVMEKHLTLLLQPVPLARHERACYWIVINEF